MLARAIYLTRVMVAFHIVLNRPTDLAVVSAAARKDESPRHSMAVLAEALTATVHDGSQVSPSGLDLLLGRATRTSPRWWATARALKRKVKPGDVIFCTGEDVGFPVAAFCGGEGGVPVAVMAHRIDSAKKRVAIRLLRLRKKIALFLTVSRLQADFLREGIGLPPDRVQFVWDQTDTDFFSPGAVSGDKSRPILMSVGLERRDYGLVAAATADLDVEVRISGFSLDAQVLSKAFPPELPANMSRRFYSWPDLRQLYRDADIVIVSLFPNRYAAGVQALMEGMASGKPVVVTATEGLAVYLDDNDGVVVVEPGNVGQMRRALTDLLAKPPHRVRLGSNALEFARKRFPCESYVKHIAAELRRLANT